MERLKLAADSPCRTAARQQQLGLQAQPLNDARAAAAAAIEFGGVEPFEVLFAPQAAAVCVDLRATVEAQYGPDLLADAAQDVGITRVVVRECWR